MGTPLGDFVRAKRDSIRPESLGLAAQPRGRAPGLRRIDLAGRAGISVEYLTRIEQGRDRNPSPAVVNALADGLSLDPGERAHLRRLAKLTTAHCPGSARPAPPSREVRPTVLATLRLLAPAPAYVTNRLGDVLAHTPGLAALLGPSGLLDAPAPNVTRYVFTDPRARTVFPDWEQLADELAFDAGIGPSASASAWFTSALAEEAGPEFTRRARRHLPPPRHPLHLVHPDEGPLRWHRERLELPAPDEQFLLVFLPADEATERAAGRLGRGRPPLRALG
ncbi:MULTISPECIES: helix-turn-helix domain-containing protein [unclassified Streptomyces]|uniref:helix-turn-helix domain-containing protein n=1 Tax=unclassified Streptomyces TaxID=2593676 RepID=UPI000BACCE88|nr:MULTISPECIES: helix-turn-helix transcriptional regulator [unclassified Streptomyces]ASY34116.1 transcriptional regulator [Streptomyces sp. CLI2509]MYX22748.1 helix-turn-helix domain-containing protein [Streptomyces sp. SID8380]